MSATEIRDWSYRNHTSNRPWLRDSCTCRNREDGPRWFTCATNMHGGVCEREGQVCGGYCRPCFDALMTDAPLRAMSFRRVAKVNRERRKRWHDPDTDAWTGADWSNAMGGEIGELVEAVLDLVVAGGKAENIVKKLRRHETRTATALELDEMSLRLALAHEIADVILYTFLVADHYDIDVGRAVVDKFNIVSELQGFPERLP